MSELLMSPETDTQFVSVGHPTRRLPGVEGVWAFVIADMTVFAVLFGSFMVVGITTPPSSKRPDTP